MFYGKSVRGFFRGRVGTAYLPLHVIIIITSLAANIEGTNKTTNKEQKQNNTYIKISIIIVMINGNNHNKQHNISTNASQQTSSTDDRSVYVVLYIYFKK